MQEEAGPSPAPPYLPHVCRRKLVPVLPPPTSHMQEEAGPSPAPPHLPRTGGSWSETCSPVITTGPVVNANLTGIAHNMFFANCGAMGGMASKLNLALCSETATVSVLQGGVLVCSELASKWG